MGFGHEKLGQRGYSIQEDGAKYGQEIIDTDSDTDPDTDERRKKKNANKSFHRTANATGEFNRSQFTIIGFSGT